MNIFKSILPIAAVCAVVAYAPGSAAQSGENSPAIKLLSRTILPDAGVVEKTAQANTRDAMTTRRHLLLQLYHLPDADERAQLADVGIELLDYVPDNAWFAAVDTVIDLDQEPFALIRWVGPILPQDKIAPALSDGEVSDWSRDVDGSVTLRVTFFKDVEAGEIDMLLAGYQAETISDSAGVYVVRFADASVITALANEDEVQWVDDGPPPVRPRDRSNNRRLLKATPRNDGARDATRVNVLQAAVPGANGSGTRLGVFDGGVDPNHPDFAGRLTVDPNHSDPANEHGTHVAGTMAGDGSNSQAGGGAPNQWRGVATAAQIFSYDNNTNQINQDYFASHQGAIQTDNIDLSQNSWGGNFNSGNCNTHNIYSVDAQNMDRIVSGEAYGRGIVVSVAASNFREGTSDEASDISPICNFNGPPDFINYFSLSDLGSAKNILSVGATQKTATDRMADFSSWGPTRDGRIKPDIVAPGDNIFSTVPGGGYGSSSGTSMSTPHISGIAALIIQRYRAVFNTQTVQPATIKAILLHSARDLQANHGYYTMGPDFASGYGIADAQAAYDTIAANRVLERSVANAATDQLTLNVGAGQAELKVTLVWDDPAPALNAATRLVNNLDLQLIAPDGATVHLPWVLDPNNPAAAATRGVDNLNNVEQVSVANPTPGAWQLRVSGTSVPNGPQRFSLVSNVAVQTGPVAGGAYAMNISTNGFIASNTAMVAGFIVTGSGGAKPFAVTAENQQGLGDVTLRLTDTSGNTIIRQNDDWQTDPSAAQLQAIAGRPLGAASDAGFVVDLGPGAYLAWLEGKNGATGTGLVAVTDGQPALMDPRIFNISTNGFIDARGLVAGFIVTGSGTRQFAITGEGSGSLGAPLQDALVRLTDISGNQIIRENDNWQTDPSAAQLQAAIGRPLTSPSDGGFLVDLAPGTYLAWVLGVNGQTGYGLVGVTEVTP